MDVYSGKYTPVVLAVVDTRPYKTVTKNHTNIIGHAYHVVSELGTNEKSNNMTTLYVIYDACVAKVSGIKAWEYSILEFTLKSDVEYSDN